MTHINSRHTPVFLKEILTVLHPSSRDVFIDATLGQGGHTKCLAEAGAHVLALDADQSQIEKVKAAWSTDSPELLTRVTFVPGNYKNIGQIAKEHDIKDVDGILYDLGLSYRQYTESGLGFSYKQKDDPLDMRLGNLDTTAGFLINNLSEDELYDILTHYAEELAGRPVVLAISRARKIKPLATVGDLTAAINTSMPNASESARERVYARVFQALRIAVNNEFASIRKSLSEVVPLLKVGGLLCIITFHSLEDRIVKQTVRELEMKELKIKIKKTDRRTFERSAMLRVYQKL